MKTRFTNNQRTPLFLLIGITVIFLSLLILILLASGEKIGVAGVIVFIDYIFDVAIPSVTCNILDRNQLLNYDYYGSPWEHEADVFGGVSNRKRTLWPNYAPSSNKTWRNYVYRYTINYLTETVKKKISEFITNVF